MDFTAVAALGSFVYAYLREFDRTPYYIGYSSTAVRPLQPHTCQLPAYDNLIVVLRSGLSAEEAFEWERYYIKRFGRKDLHNGLLLNQTDGGEGTPGRVVSKTTRQKIADANRGRVVSLEQRKVLREHNLGKKQSPQTIAKRIEKISGPRGPQPRVQEAALVRGQTQRKEAAERWGIPSEVYMKLNQRERNKYKLWLTYNPDYTFEDRERAMAVFGDSPKLAQMMRNADKTGHSWEEWRDMSHKRRNTALRRVRDLQAA